jgi:diphthamide synthase (EF-2-diphthine--ammonia ligase)
MRTAVGQAVADGFTCVAFGDLFLEDVRKYREEKLAGTGLAPLFPIWGIPTDELAARMVDTGLRSVLTCVNPKHLDRSFAGRQFDRTLLNDLPAGVDKCGERGEFHSFAWDGPMFKHPVSITVGEVVERDGYVFADVS